MASSSEPDRKLARTVSPLSELDLIERYTPKIRRIVRAVLGPDSEHDDLVHEVLIKVLTGVGRLDDSDSLDTWVTRVTVNTLRATMRWRKLRRHPSWEHIPEPQMPSGQPDLEGRDIATRAVRTLARIPEGERLLLLRHWFTEATVDELAADSGCSPVTIKRRLRRARARFERLARKDPALARRLAERAAAGRPWLQSVAERLSGVDEPETRSA